MVRGDQEFAFFLVVRYSGSEQRILPTYAVLCERSVSLLPRDFQGPLATATATDAQAGADAQAAVHSSLLLGVRHPNNRGNEAHAPASRRGERKRSNACGERHGVY